MERVRTVTASGAISATDDYIILIDCTAGNVTLTLPALSALYNGRQYTFKKIDGTDNIGIIDAYGSELIDGSLTMQIITENETKKIVSNGTAFYTI